MIIKIKINLNLIELFRGKGEEKLILTVDERKVEKLRQKLSISIINIIALHRDQFIAPLLKEKVGINISL